MFWANSQALKEAASQITPEHILRGVLKEDPQLFALIIPQNPKVANELERNLAGAMPSANESLKSITRLPAAKERDEGLRLSESAKEILRVAARERLRLGHRTVATQHLLLALAICPEPRKTWFSRTASQGNSVAKQFLAKSGLDAASIESATKGGIVTEQVSIFDEPISKLSAQLNALAELLLSRGVFTRTEFVALLDKNEGPITSDILLLPLIDALVEKGKLTQAEKVTLLDAKPSSGAEKSDSAR